MADWRLSLIRRRRLLKLFLFAASAMVAISGRLQPAPATAATSRQKRTTMSAYDFEFPGIEGGSLPLKAWRGKPILVANTASFCGYTPQYKDLEALWNKYKARGLVVLGVPSNDFGQQEPGSAKEIKAFCESYDVSFPLADKQKVIGADAHPFYRWIAAELGDAGVPRWNFHKYLIDANGEIVGAWPSRVTPLSREVTEAVEQALKP
ncbi:MAG TPA: glutathione peroxidase [Alphaproteobacteria bacterium]|nr:glutathione peroxidase [Alphaproteobacteria bacterium]